MKTAAEIEQSPKNNQSVSLSSHLNLFSSMWDFCHGSELNSDSLTESITHSIYYSSPPTEDVRNLRFKNQLLKFL